MKVAIIGAGNMGGSIACGLAKGKLIPASDIIVSNPSIGKLEALKKEFPSIAITRNNAEAATGADIVILAVKPWLIRGVLREMKLRSKQILVSVAAGISFEQLAHDVVEPEMPMFRIVPNTAISELQSMTLIASRNAGQELEALMVNLFSEMGMAMILPEDKLENSGSHRIDLLRYRLRTEIYSGCHASGHRNGNPAIGCHGYDCPICKRCRRTDTEQ